MEKTNKKYNLEEHIKTLEDKQDKILQHLYMRDGVKLL